MKLLLSIKPEFVDKIISGEKIYEYRKSLFKRKVESVVVYTCKPVGLIVGEFIVGEIIQGAPQEVWAATNKGAGINYEFYSDYFKGKKKANAIEIREFFLYKEPLDPYKYFDKFTPPQSYKYFD